MTEQTEVANATSTHSAGDLDVWELTLPEDEAGCEWLRPCQSPASWRGVKPCCGRSALFCGPHKESSALGQRVMIMLCSGCGQADTGTAWHAI